MQSRPSGVIALAILAFLNVLTYVGLIILSIADPNGLRTLLASLTPGAAAGAVQLMRLGAFVPVYFLAMAIVAGLVGRGLWQLKNWARITMLVLASLSLIATLAELVMNAGGSGGPAWVSIMVRLGIGGLVVWYLSTARVRSAFGKEKSV